MEVAESREPTSVGPPTTGGSTFANGDDSLLLDVSLIDDGRSSSLSEIDDVSDNEPFDYEPPKPEKAVPENDSEAETERIEDSPSHLRLRRDIVVSAGGPVTSPSKLAQSTTYDDVEDDEEHTVTDSPSKPQRPSTNNGVTKTAERAAALEESTLTSETLGKKRKRAESGDDTGTELGEDEPLKKRRGSVKSDLSEPVVAATPISPEPTEELSKAVEESTPAEDVHELELPAVIAKGKKGKKGKRKGRKVREVDEETETGGVGHTDDHLEDNETAEHGEEAEDAEAIAKHEEECKLDLLEHNCMPLLTFTPSSEKDVSDGVLGGIGTGVR